MNRYFYNLLNEAVSCKEENTKVFDSRSSERLARDEVVIRPVKDPNRALLDAIRDLLDDGLELEVEQRKRA